MIHLETLDFSKNLLTRIPVELSNCINLNEVLFNDNKIIEIPTKLINLPHLEVFEADGRRIVNFIVKETHKIVFTFRVLSRISSWDR